MRGLRATGLRVQGLHTGKAQMRRRALTVAALATIVFAIGSVQIMGAFAAGIPSRPVDRDLSSYVLFAFDTLEFKGGQSPDRGIIKGGDVGAGGIDTTPNNSSPILNICANAAVTMDDGTQVNADTMRITNLCKVWDVYANKLTGGSDVVPTNSGPTAFTTPLLSTMPTIPAFNCDANNPVTVTKGNTATLPPGTYGNTVFQDNTNVTLQPGIYNFCDLHVGKNAVVTTVAGVEIRIAETFSISNDTLFGNDCNVPIYVRADGHTGANDVAINFSKDTTVFGRFLTLLGKIALGHTTNLNGQFVGHSMISDWNVNVGPCEGGGGTTTTSSSSSSTSSTSTSSTSTSSTTSTSTSTSTTSTTSTSTSTSTTSTSTTTTTVPETTSTTTSTTTTSSPSTSTSTITTSTTSSTSTSTTSTTAGPTTTTSTLPETSRRSTTTTSFDVADTTVRPQDTTPTSNTPGTLTPNGTPNDTPNDSTLPFTGAGSNVFNAALLLFVVGGVLLALSGRRFARR